MKFRNIGNLALKELIHLWRDKRTFIFLLLMPSVLTAIFGLAIGNNELTGIKTRVVDLDHGRIAQEYIKDIRTSQTFDLEVIENATDEDLRRANEDLQRDHLKAIVVLPKQLTSQLVEGQKGEVQAIVDASDTFAAPVVMRSLYQVAIKYNMKLAGGYMLYECPSVKTEEQATLRVAPVDLKTDFRYNPDLKVQNFTIPGVIGLILQILTVIVMSTSIAKERERGTMEQLAVTPLTGTEIFLGKLLPYFMISVFDTLNAMIVAKLLFNIELKGQYISVSVLMTVFILASLGVGQLISTVSKNQGQAVQLAIFYILPVFVMSGAFAPIEAIPAKIRPITYLFPLTYFCRSFRASILRQSSLYDLRLDLAALLVFVILTFGVSILLLRRRPGQHS